MTFRSFTRATLIACAALALLVLPCSTFAQDTGRGGGATGSGGQGMQTGQGMDRQSMQDTMQAIRSADNPDKLFLIEAAIGSQAEMELAQLAQQKSQNPQVKQIAQRLIDDHGKMMQQLQNVAQAENVQLPKMLPSILQQEKKVMETLDGKQFDQHFLSAMRCMHAKDVAKFQDVSQLAQSQAVKQFASKQLPTLTAHRSEIDRAAVAMGLPPSSGTGDAQPAGSTIRGSGSDTGSGSGGGSSR